MTESCGCQLAMPAYRVGLGLRHSPFSLATIELLNLLVSCVSMEVADGQTLPTHCPISRLEFKSKLRPRSSTLDHGELHDVFNIELS